MSFAAVVGLAYLFSPPLAAHPRELSFEERVEAQHAIERLYYSHQIGATLSFEEAVPRPLLEKKVRVYLRQSVALEKIWRTPVTAEALRRELARIARDTRFPDRLREIYSALGNDPFRIEECFARPFLVDRLARNFYAADRRYHQTAWAEMEAIRERLTSGALGVESEESRRTVAEFVRSESSTAEADGVPPGRIGPGILPQRIPLESSEYRNWRARLPGRAGEIGPIQEERDALILRVLLEERSDAFRVATYTIPKRPWDAWWIEVAPRLDLRRVPAVAAPDDPLPVPAAGLVPRRTAAESSAFEPTSVREITSSSCVPDDTWDSPTWKNFPEPRAYHTAVWTGSMMIVWGGSNGSSLNTGWRYDPATDTWAPVSTLNAPEGRLLHAAVWTGSRMVIWGGYNGSTYFTTGGRYDPVADTWNPTSLLGNPGPRTAFTAVWTGTIMIVWGGVNGSSSLLSTGGRYDPAADTWALTSTAFPAPTNRRAHSAVWTGSRMVIWGGFDNSNPCCGGPYTNSGGQYDPLTNSWTSLSLTNAPSQRSGHRAVWTGGRMIVWGGGNGSILFNDGGRYDPALDTWAALSTAGAPTGRENHSAIWTGSQMIIWGGSSSQLGAGGRYDPVGDTWIPISALNAPSVRYSHTAVWAGDRMIIWGGYDFYTAVATGGRYDPATDTWTPTAALDGPHGRDNTTAVWTGNLMVVWGGAQNTVAVDTGGRYDPVSDSWTPTPTVGVPQARAYHTAVWTGSRMVVWGGQASTSPSILNTGGRYDPIADAWTPTSTVDAPGARRIHTAVWTGSRMIIWGGDTNGGPHPTTGGLYDPVSDTWTATSTLNAPEDRYSHSATWTGSAMIIWGGRSPSSAVVLNSGARYDPASDSWIAISNVSVPSPRYEQTTIWTGSAMVVWGGRDNAGTYLGTGGRYDPAADAWVPTTLTGAPPARTSHTAVWTGRIMIIWGGGNGSTRFNDGGRYDPTLDTWAPTSLVDAPPARGLHAAVWTGGFMIVWGGLGQGNDVNTWGRYALGQLTDADGDGITVCAGDCDDANPAVHPGATEICNGIDDDCANGIDVGGNVLCADTESCTTDVCAGVAGCSHSPVPDGTACSSGSACLLGETCLAGSCQGGSPKDADADAHLDATCGGDDCNDADALVWFSPLEVANLSLTTSSPADPGWDDQGSLVGPETRYDLVSGPFTSVPGLDFSMGSCLMSGSSSTSYLDGRPDPVEGSGFWYLVRAKNSCGTGSYGAGSNMVDRTVSGCP